MVARGTGFAGLGLLCRPGGLGCEVFSQRGQPVRRTYRQKQGAACVRGEVGATARRGGEQHTWRVRRRSVVENAHLMQRTGAVFQALVK